MSVHTVVVHMEGAGGVQQRNTNTNYGTPTDTRISVHDGDNNATSTFTSTPSDRSHKLHPRSSLLPRRSAREWLRYCWTSRSRVSLVHVLIALSLLHSYYSFYLYLGGFFFEGMESLARRDMMLENRMMESFVGDKFLPHVAQARCSAPLTSLKPLTEEVHLAFVVSGDAKYTNGMVAVLNSLLLYTPHDVSVVVHVITATESEKVDLEAVGRDFVERVSDAFARLSFDVRVLAPSLLAQVATLESTHYSGLPGLTKLLFEQALPELERVVVLDTDVLLFDDVSTLWRGFDTHISADALFGMVSEHSGWYSSKERLGKIDWRWPHVRDGFNSGVMLLNLEKMRASDWKTMWRTVYDSVVAKHPTWTLTLGDQDVYNAVVAFNPSLLSELPCNWNLQDSGLHKAGILCGNDNVVVFHMNYMAKRGLYFHGLRDAVTAFATSQFTCMKQ